MTRLQALPFADLTWQNFERLCFRLASRSDQAEDWQRYGRQGQAQAGIDIFVRRPDGRYDVWQCKRYRQFGPAQVRDAAKAFIEGEWVRRSATLTLCVSAGLDDVDVQKEVEEQSRRLRAFRVVLRAMGADRLSDELKSHPDIVDDFFGRAWVRAVCGEDAVGALRRMRHRLDGAAVARLRDALFRFYDEYFKVLDRGFAGTSNYPGETPEPPPLLERFVILDVLVRQSVVPAEVRDDARALAAGERMGQDDHFQGSHRADGDAAGRSAAQTFEAVSRRRLGDWLAEGPQSLLLGDAGSGKSTALRCLALDLLSGRSAFPELAQLWGRHLPILIPFSKWTHLAVGRSEGVPLEEVVRTWLEGFSVDPDLVALAVDALHDRRLLLLVDGLDEWANETAARTVLAQLATVVRTHAIAAVATGRPQGVARLGNLGASWRTGTLAPLSEPQQRRLVAVWFGVPDTSAESNRTGAGPDVRERLAEVQVEDFFRDLREAGGLEALAGTPLLLTGLIVLRTRRIALPRDRFRAYQELATLLLEVHPESRARAAAEGVPRFKALSDPDLRRQALGRLAYEIRLQGADAGFPKRDAVRVITDFLRNDDEAGLPPERARAGALELLAVNAETSEILIEKAPGEVGFVHALFEEHLAAVHVSGWPLAKQEQLLAEHCVDARWRNVILNLFRLLSRPSEVDSLVARLEAVDVVGPGEIARRLLLAETAFGESRLSARTARRIADTTFDEIEGGAWMPEREALLRVAMRGLDSERLQEPTRERVRRWFPGTLRSRRELFLAMAHWPRGPELWETLWRGIFGADDRSRDAAAQALAEAYAGDPGIEARLLASVRRPLEPPVAGALLRSLARGWPNAEGLDALIDEGRAACARVLRLAAVRAAVDRWRQTDADRDWLLSEARERSVLLYERHQDVVEALLEGWPSDPVVFQAAISACQSGYRRADNLNRDIAWEVLLRGYARAPEVINEVRRALHSGRPLPLPVLQDSWDLLLATYKRHPALWPAFDSWAESFASEWQVRERELAFACAASGSEEAKKRLLEQLRSVDQEFVFWPVFGLLEGWGMGDPEVAGALQALARGSPQAVQYFAQHLPTILDDKTACRSRLLEIARLSDVARPDFLVMGLATLGLDHRDTEVVDAVIPLIRPPDSNFDPTARLIAQFGRAPKVREIAKGLASSRNAPLAAMAAAYCDDEEMRRVIADRAAPLPTSLRRTLVTHAARRCRASADLAQLLAAYDDERDARVRTAASAGHYRRIRAERLNTDEASEHLLRQVRSLGPELDSLRQSALAGLISLGRLRAIVEEVFEGERTLRVAALGPSFEVNDVLLQLLAEHWGEVVAALGCPPFDRLVRFSDTDPLTCWESLAPYLGASPKVRHDFLKFCASTEKPLTSECLSALARLRPGSSLLMAHCQRALAETVSDPKLSPLDLERRRLVAGKILGSTFAGDERARELLEDEASRQNPGALVGLCLGWPNSITLDRAYEEMVRTGASFPVALHLGSVRADADAFERIVTTAIDRANGDVWQFIPEWVDPVASKLASDEASFDRFLERLEVTTHPDERASLPRLLAIASGRDERLREWCQHQLTALMAGQSLADFGFDVVANRERPVAHALLDILMPY